MKTLRVIPALFCCVLLSGAFTTTVAAPEAGSSNLLDQLFPGNPPATRSLESLGDPNATLVTATAGAPEDPELAAQSGAGATLPALPKLPPVGDRPKPAAPGAAAQPAAPGGRTALNGMTGISITDMPLIDAIALFNGYLGENYILEVSKDGLDPKTLVSYKYEAFRELTVPEIGEIFDDFMRNVESDAGFRLAVERTSGKKYLRQAYDINTEKQSLPELLDKIAEYLQINYILDPKAATGKSITIVTHKNVYLTKNQIWDVFYTLLNLNGLAMFEKGAYYQIIPAPELAEKGTDIRYPSALVADLNLTDAFNQLDSRADNDRYIVEIVPLKFIAPQEVMTFIKPFMTKTANVVNPPNSNLLIMTETQANLKKILKLIEMIDLGDTMGGLEVFEIVYADATEISNVIQKILTSKARALVQPAAPTDPRARRAAAAAATSGGSGGQGSNVMIHADKRSNSIIIFGDKRDLEFSRQIIQILDRDIYSASRTFIYYAEYAKAEDLAKLLNSVYKKSSSSSSNSPSQGERANAARAAASAFTGQQTQASGTGEKSAEDGSISGEFNIVSDTRTNSLVIVASELDYQKILTLLKKVDVAPRQVLIEILYAEINLDRQNQFGVNWSLLTQGSVTLGGKTYGFDGVAKQALGVGSDGFTFNLFEASRFQATLRALGSDNRLRVLSNPHMVASNNVEAKIEIGDKIPIVTSQISNDTNLGTVSNEFRQNVEYRDTGIILTITPSINENRFVTMEIDQEISEVADRQSAGATVNPTIQNRSIKTTVLVQDAMSLVLGGLIRSLDSQSRSGLPYFSDIPYLGALFANNLRRKQNIELLTVITPHVIISSQDATLASDSLWERDKSVRDYFNANKERFY